MIVAELVASSDFFPAEVAHYRHKASRTNKIIEIRFQSHCYVNTEKFDCQNILLIKSTTYEPNGAKFESLRDFPRVEKVDYFIFV